MADGELYMQHSIWSRDMQLGVAHVVLVPLSLSKVVVVKVGIGGRNF